jgi:hypothetical protein
MTEVRRYTRADREPFLGSPTATSPLPCLGFRPPGHTAQPVRGPYSPAPVQEAKRGTTLTLLPNEPVGYNGRRDDSRPGHR